MWLMIAALMGLLLIGAPLGIALGLSSLLFIILYTDMDLVVMGHKFVFFTHHYALMAVPFFIFAGFLMERTGLIGQIFDFATAAFSWIRGGLGVATLSTCVVFASMTGSSVAEASAMSVIAIPRMQKEGYPDRLAAGIVCSGGTLGLLIPPSVSFIIYGFVTDTSIVQLFFAGMMPGIMLGILLITVALAVSWRMKLATSPLNIRRVMNTAKSSIAGFGLPVIVLGGLYGGVFTPTEAGAAACAYAMLYGLIAQRKTFLKALFPVTARAVNLTAMIFFLLGGFGIFAAVCAYEYWPQQLAAAIIAMDLSRLEFIFGFMVLLLVMGCFLDGIAMILLTIPVVFPIALSLGIDPLHLGVLLIINIELGVITPPVGFNLYAVSGISRIPIPEVLKGVAPFFLMMLVFLVFMVFFPDVATWLPKILFKPIIWG